MAFTPFGKDVGPSMNPKPSPFRPVGQFPRPPSSTHPTSGPPTQRAPPPLAFQNPSPSAGQPYQSGGIQRSPEPVDRTLSPPLASQRPRPSVRPYLSPGAQSGIETPKRFPLPDLAYQPAGIQRPIQVPHSWGDGSRSFSKDLDEQSLSRPGAGASYVVSRSSGTNAAEIGRFQDPRKTSLTDLPTDQSSGFPPRKQSPISGFENGRFVNDCHPPSSHTWKRSPSSAEDNLVRSKSNPYQLAGQDQSPKSSYAGSYGAAEMQDFTRGKFSTVAPSHRVFQDKPRFAQNDSRRVSTSPPALGSRSYIPSTNSDSLVLGQSSSTNNLLNHTSKTSSSPAAKRTRSPPLLSAEEVVQGSSIPSQDGTEREDQAKAKRLARFKGELEAMPVRPLDTQDTKSSVKTMKPLNNEQKFNSLQSNRDALKGDVLSEYESSEPSSVIIGLCPDMCPESEREERERKGDLDQYERVDGDRNQTSKYLAVKKYNRTAEREAILIRPMPILQKTMDYLLNLLDQPYDDSFLGMYNFLWDRMRAIRMDLRMQHIFNQEAITMLEQMIRLHIIAMHELCEYTKGEGFSEGFDAHLNIEQMNKTSVELFQMYDDHRKKGIHVPTEKEFRGYYALLKLDKHPGYKVEPAELSLELAKMTAEIRQTSEVLFARDVARACRTGNFIAFFRLARKASYLQACVMHAHFAKLRTQALASLHSGLLNNQGLPVSDVSKWIGMEEEDIEALLEYHGFSIKEFEEPYMMKDGLFLHADKDYLTKCSKLVHLKKSRTILEDVCAPSSSFFSTEATKETQPSTATHKQDAPPARTLKKQSSLHVFDQEMPDSNTSLLPEESKPKVPLVIKPMIDQQNQDDLRGAGVSLSPQKFSSPHGSPRFQPAETRWRFSSPHGSPRFPQAETRSMEKPFNDTRFDIIPGEIKFPLADAMLMNIVSGAASRQSSPKSMPRQKIPVASVPESSSRIENEYASEDSLPETILVNNFEEDFRDIDRENENENGIIVHQYDEEVTMAKLKLIIRLWKRWSSRQREFRERRQLAASAALNSLSLGPPIRFIKDDQPRAFGEFDIDQAMGKRFRKHEQSWSRLNISDVIAGILSKRNPDSKCLCWKVILCTQKKSANESSTGRVMHFAASHWVLSKLMPCAKDGLRDDYLPLSTPGVSVWKKWVTSQSSSEFTCCLSVVRDVEVDNDLHKTACGASAVLFLVSEAIPWNLQRDQLNSIVMSVPPGSCLPLLVISSSYNGDGNPTNFADELCLHDIDRSRVSSFSVVSLVNKTQTGREDQFFSDKCLREGLKWLANHSPPQPTLHCVKPRELVLTHLSFSLELLKKMPNQEVSPNLCIAAFNDALDRLLGNIASSAEANPFGWPCPEIALLEEWRKEHLTVKCHLPIIGWSSEETVQPLISALNNCKLPSFQDDLTWLTIGCGLGGEIENQRHRLESCLVEYLTQTSNLMGLTLATKEAGVLIQRNTRLELYNSSYHLIPRWVLIFQRIFNWRLLGFPDASSSSAYVLKSDLPVSASSYLDKLEVEETFYPSSSSPNLLSLDEIIDASFSPIKSPHPPPMPLLDHEAQEAFDRDESTVDNRREASGRLNMMMLVDEFVDETDESEKSRGGDGVEDDKLSTGVERFSELLEKCNIVQNSIARKLSIYF